MKRLAEVKIAEGLVGTNGHNWAARSVWWLVAEILHCSTYPHIHLHLHLHVYPTPYSICSPQPLLTLALPQPTILVRTSGAR